MGVLGGSNRSRRLGRGRFYELVLAPLTARERLVLGLACFGLLAILIIPAVRATDSEVGTFIRAPFSTCQTAASWNQSNQASGQPDAIGQSGFDPARAAVATGGGQGLVCGQAVLGEHTVLNAQIGLTVTELSQLPVLTPRIDTAALTPTVIDPPSTITPGASSVLDGIVRLSYSVDDGANWLELYSLSASEIDRTHLSVALPPLSPSELETIQVRAQVVAESDTIIAIDSLHLIYQVGEPAELELRLADSLSSVPLLGPNQESFATLRLKPAGNDAIDGLAAAGQKLIGQAIGEPDTEISARLVDDTGRVTPLSLNREWKGVSADGSYAWELDIIPPRSLDPGRYRLVSEVTAESGETIEQSQPVLWGVAAFNLDKSNYKINESARLMYSVLDERGATICDAAITTEIWLNGRLIETLATSTGTIKVTDTCEEYGGHIAPDYEAAFSPAETGSYELSTTIVSSSGTYRLQDRLYAEASPLFVVARSGPTRIFPVRNYTMQMVLTANQAFTGDIIETIPASFTLVPNEVERAYDVSVDGAEQQLRWGVSLQPGDELIFRYEFDAPDISPEFYTLGPLVLTQNSVETFSEPRAWQIAGDAIGRMILLYDGGTIPTNWTCVSCTSGDPFYQLFPRGNDTYGGTGGSLTHNHTASASVATTGNTATTTGNAGSVISGNDHTHTASLTIGPASNLPLYRDLKLIRHNTAGEPSTLPAGVIGLFDASLPGGWTQYSAQNGYYVRGEGTAGTTGGSNTHVHTLSGSVQSAGGTTYGTRSPTNTPAANAGHTHAYSGNSDSSNHEPLYIEVILAQLGSSAAPPNGLISFWDDEVPSNWSVQSESSGAFYQRYFKASSTYGATGGNASHGHNNSVIASGGPDATTNTRSGSDAASSTHTHNVTVSGFSSETHLPPYRDVVVGKRVPQPDVDLSAYRFYRNLDDTDVGTPLASQDTAAAAPRQGTPFRLRLNLHISGANLGVGGRNFKLQYSLRSGTCDTGFSGESYVDVSPSSGAIRYYDNAGAADGDALTTNAQDPTHNSDTIVAQTYEESNNFTNTAIISAGEDGLWDFSLVDHSATASSSYCFRVVRSNDDLLQNYSVLPEVITDDGQGHMLLFYDGGTIPNGWTCVSCNPGDDLYQRFIRGNTAYGATGGSATHSHTASASVLATTNLTIENQAGSGLASGGHSHTFTPTISAESNLPLYRQLKIIRANSSGTPTTIPSGAIALYDGTLPGGWTQYSAQNGYYVRGEGTAGATGGSNTHVHTITGTTSAGSGSTSAATNGNTIPGAADTHTHSVNDTLGTAQNHEPPYREVILAQADSDTSVPQNIITVWDGSIPGTWTNISGSGEPFYERFIKASSTYGATGGNVSHSHADETITSLGPSAASNYRTGTVNADGSHTHDINLTNFSTDNHLPPYVDVVIAKLGTLNTNPDNPANLGQERTSDSSSISVGGWANGGQVRFTADATDTDNPDSLQLCVEVETVGTAFDNVDTACGSGVNFTGTAVAVTVTVSGLANGSDYHWQARIKDGGGGVSAWVSFGGNLESEADFSVDSTNPAGTVYDGTTVSVDAEFNDGALDSLSANWNIADNESGIDEYEYAIGTAPGGTDVINYTSVGTSTSVTATSLNLRTSVVYYFTIRATDVAGNEGVVSSDGQLVAPTLSFTASPTNVIFDNLNSLNNYTDIQTTTLTTDTNAYNGYEVRAYATSDLTSAGGDTIGFFSGGSYVSPDAWETGDIGFGYTSNDNFVGGVNRFGSTPCAGGGNPPCYAPFSTLAPGDIVADHTALVQGAPVIDENFIITHRVSVDPSQPAGTYGTQIIFSITARY